MELLAATQALSHRERLEPGFKIPHRGLERILRHSQQLSPILMNDRYTVPEYQQLLHFISSGQLWDIMLEEMGQQYFAVDIPQEYRQSINT